MTQLTNPQVAGSAPVGGNAADIRDIAPPVAIPSGWEWVWWLVGALAVAALVYAVWNWWRRRRATPPVVPVIPAHVRARERLQAALALIAQAKPFCVEVSDTVRFYLEQRFEFHAPERTTEEFLHELQRTELLTRDQKDSLGDFLQSCDLVKFAKYEPQEPELRTLHDSALRLVAETEPRPAPASAAAAEPVTK